MPEDEVEKFLYEKFTHFKSFCFSFAFCIYIYILCDGINVRDSIRACVLHLFINLFENTEVEFDFLIHAFYFISPQAFALSLILI